MELKTAEPQSAKFKEFTFKEFKRVFGCSIARLGTMGSTTSLDPKSVTYHSAMSEMIRLVRIILPPYEPFKVITNGYGEFKCIGLEDRDIPAKEIFKQIEQHYK